MKKNIKRAIAILILAVSLAEASPSSAISNYKVLTLGDSITAGMDDKNGWVGNLVSNLDKLLKKSGYKWEFLGDYSRDNITRYQGDGGFCLASIKYKCSTNTFKKQASIMQLYLDYHKKNPSKIDLFIIQGGINDINSAGGVNPPPEPIISMKALISTIRKDYPDSLIVLQGITRPTLDSLELSYNKKLANLKMKKVYYVDTTKANKDSYFIDGLHPNSEGYKAFARINFDQMRRLKIIK